MLTIPTTYVKNDFDQLYFKTMISMMELLQRENLRRPVTSRGPSVAWESRAKIILRATPSARCASPQETAVPGAATSEPWWRVCGVWFYSFVSASSGVWL